MSAWPRRQAALNRSQLRATAPLTPNDGRDSTSLRRRGANSTRSWPSFTKNWGWTRALRSTTCTGYPCAGAAP
jgi:hypothetical protein